MLKRSFDITASFIGLIFLLPLLGAVSFLIFFKMGRPIFFRQERGGRHGVSFTIVKFRTMENVHDGSSISVKGQGRITPLGSILRKYKLDELPELWNILKGDMSFVGPRPDVPKYFDGLKGEEKLILNLRPGLTGPATLKYADEEELLANVSDPKEYNDAVIWPDKVRINLEYYRNQNFFEDIRLIIRTLIG